MGRTTVVSMPGDDVTQSETRFMTTAERTTRTRGWSCTLRLTAKEGDAFAMYSGTWFVAAALPALLAIRCALGALLKERRYSET